MTDQGPSTASGPAAAVEIDNLHRELECLAQKGKWSELAELMKHRDELLSKMSDIDRSTKFRAAIRSNARMLKLVRTDRQSIARRLTSLRRSREMAGRYIAHRGAGTSSSES